MTDPGPRVEGAGDALYLVTSAGERWRVHDVCFGPPVAAPGRRKRLPLGDPRANYRWFVGADRTQRCIALTDDQSISAEVLARQLAGAGYVNSTRDNRWPPPAGDRRP